MPWHARSRSRSTQETRGARCLLVRGPRVRRTAAAGRLRGLGCRHEVLGHVPDRFNAFYAVVDPDGVGPRIFLQQVPEGKTAKNRMHIDVGVEGEGPERIANARGHARHLVGLGGVVLQEIVENDEFWIVMQDPEGTSSACSDASPGRIWRP
ncbi:VOC family protein [Oerskovia sp. M15]